MPNIARQASCGARNAFRPTLAIWQLFIGAPPPLALRRQLSVSAPFRQGDAVAPAQPKPPSKESANQDSPPLKPETSQEQPLSTANSGSNLDPHYNDINPDSLSDTLERHRETNRASILRKEFTNPTNINYTNKRKYRPLQIRQPEPASSEQPPETDGQLNWFDHLSLEDPAPDPTEVNGELIQNTGKINVNNKNSTPNTGPEDGESPDLVLKPHTSKRDWSVILPNIAKQAESIADSSPSTEETLSDILGEKWKRVLQAKKQVTQQAAKSEGKKRQGKPTKPDQARPVLDYQGLYVKPVHSQVVMEGELPWARKWSGHARPFKPTAEGLEPTTGVDRLGMEIQDFSSYMRPTPFEAAAREAVIAQIAADIRRQLPDNEIEVFGSHRTGLAVATSDLDFRIMPSKKDTAPQGKSDAEKAPRHVVRVRLTRRLESLVPAFESNLNYMLVILRHSRYPLIGMQHKPSGLDIQMVCSNDSSISRDLTYRYLQEYPTLLALFHVIRTTMEVRGLTDVFRGGMGSYSILMMIVATLKLDQLLRPEIFKLNDYSAHLISFLEFYGHLDTNRLAVSTDPPAFFPKIGATLPLGRKVIKEMKSDRIFEGRMLIGIIDEMSPFLLCLQDPADPQNDLGRKCFGWKHVQKTFKVLLESLQQRTSTNSRRSLLAPMVGACYEPFEKRRLMLREYGREIGIPDEQG